MMEARLKSMNTFDGIVEREGFEPSTVVKNRLHGKKYSWVVQRLGPLGHLSLGPLLEVCVWVWGLNAHSRYTLS